MDDLLLPLFPLDIVLLPEEPLALHIFEERNKSMIGECLEAQAKRSGLEEFGVVFTQGQEIRSVGCTARIINLTRKYPDGRMDIFTVGNRRFEILYTNEERPFLRGAVEFFDDDNDLPNEDEAQNAIDLFREAMQRIRRSADMPIHLPRPYRHLSFRIAAPLPLDLDFKQQLLSVRNESERLREVTRALDRLIGELDFVQKARRKAGGNGDLQIQG